jgi:uncharacterized protein DUF4198
MRSRWSRLLPPLLLAALTTSLAAHDLFLKLADFVVRPETTVRITALNGTFTTSENSIARARIADLSVAGPGGRKHLDTTAVAADGPRTAIEVQVGPPGTYVAGLSLLPSSIAEKGPQFNAYLKEEGLNAVLEDRRAKGELGKAVTERYAKHVKVAFQAGAALGDAWNVALGYPVEIVPLANPYALRAGDTLRVKLLVNGAAAAGRSAIAAGRSRTGARLPEQRVRADGLGVVPVVLGSTGTWYVKFIEMTRSSERGVDYVSQWATLTFAVPRGRAKP